ncbi:MAG: fluoride efflux transporter CrcB [Actinomycetota bacterium]|nr:fluoride efflux transporter CrcB [Actinomycetota bacterium]
MESPLTRRDAIARSRYPEPVDPDLLPRPAGRGPLRTRPGVLVAVAAGGVLGSCARYELGLVLASRSGSFPLGTFVINVSGSLVLGALLALIIERWRPTHYLRPFVATGFLGAYTTWSTFMLDTDNLIRAGHAGMAVGYVSATLTAGLAAVYAGMTVVRSRPPAVRHRNREEDG